MLEALLVGLLGEEASPLLQYLRPDGHVSASTWQPYGAEQLYDCINDESADEDSTYCYNQQNGGYLTVTLSNPNPAGVYIDPSDPHKVVVRAKYVGTGGTPFMNILLMQGVSPIAQSLTNYLTTSYADYEMELTAEEIASISNYDDLRIAIEVFASVGSGYAARVTQEYMLIGSGYTYPLWDHFTVASDTDLSAYTGPESQTYGAISGRWTVLDAIDRVRGNGATGYSYGYQNAAGVTPQVGDEFVCELIRGTALTGAARVFGFVFMAEGDQTNDHVEINFTCDNTSTVKFYGQSYVQGVGYQDIQTFDLTLACADGAGYRIIAVLKSVVAGTSMTFDIYTEPVGGGGRTLRYSNWTLGRDWVDVDHKFLGI